MVAAITAPAIGRVEGASGCGWVQPGYREQRNMHPVAIRPLDERREARKLMFHRVMRGADGRIPIERLLKSVLSVVRGRVDGFGQRAMVTRANDQRQAELQAKHQHPNRCQGRQPGVPHQWGSEIGCEPIAARDRWGCR